MSEQHKISVEQKQIQDTYSTVIDTTDESDAKRLVWLLTNIANGNVKVLYNTYRHGSTVIQIHNTVPRENQEQIPKSAKPKK